MRDGVNNYRSSGLRNALTEAKFSSRLVSIVSPAIDFLDQTGILMSISGKHFYRFKYLRSEHWQNLRIAKLAKHDAKCCICRERDLSNDVHHIHYRNLYDVTLDDLRVLCRKCHNDVHRILDECATIKNVGDAELRWQKVVRRNRKRIRSEKKRQLVMIGMTRPQIVAKIRRQFKQVKHRLRRKNLICRGQLGFRQRNPNIVTWYNSIWPTVTDEQWIQRCERFHWPCGDH